MIMISRLALLAGSEVELLNVVLLDLLQPIQAVLALHVCLRPLEMVPSDLPFVLLDLLQPIHIYRLYTYIQAVYTGCSCPSGPSEASVNGPK